MYFRSSKYNVQILICKLAIEISIADWFLKMELTFLRYDWQTMATVIANQMRHTVERTVLSSYLETDYMSIYIYTIKKFYSANYKILRKFDIKMQLTSIPFSKLICLLFI